MTHEEVRAFVHRYVEHLRAHDAEALARCFAVDALVESPSVGTHRGRDAIEKGYRRWFASFPDLEFTPEAIVVEESAVSLAFRNSGTHQGGFLVSRRRGNGWSFAACSYSSCGMTTSCTNGGSTTSRVCSSGSAS